MLIFLFKNMLSISEQNKTSTNTSRAYLSVSKFKACQEFVTKVQGKKPLFILVIGGTETALIPGLSAAGQNMEQLKLTPALDSDFLTSKTFDRNKKIPLSPNNIPSPVILSKAVIDMLELEVCIIDVGTFVKPKVVHIDLNMGPAKSIKTGSALDPVKTSFLFQKGEKLASSLTNYPYLVIGECIPGGTTTALSVLCALGVNAFDLVNSSFPEGNHFWKNETVKESLLTHSNLFPQIKKNPMKAVEFFGDPVQAFICGLLKGIQKFNIPTMLAGGSQMLAIYHLIKLITESELYGTVVATTSWIANDKNAKTKYLAELVKAPLMCSTVHFKESKLQGLYAYEEGHIKEGVGAGGLMVAANLYKNISQEEIIKEIEKIYSQIIL